MAALLLVRLLAIVLPAAAAIHPQERGQPPLRHGPSAERGEGTGVPGVAVYGTFPGNAGASSSTAMLRGLVVVLACDAIELALDEF